MPRLRKPPKEEIQVLPDETPLTESIEIEIDDPAAQVEIQLAQDDPPELRHAPSVVPEVEDDPVRRALEATQRAEELQQQLAAEQRRTEELQRQARSRDHEIARERASAEDAQYNSVLTAIAAEEASVEKAEADYAAFAAAQDWANAARAQRNLATASSRLDRLQDNKQAFDARREDNKRNPPQPARQETQTPEQHIAALGVPENAKSWLRQHPDLVSDSSKNRRLGAVHNYLTDNKGIAAFSQAYFDALDAEFGFRAPPPAAPPAPAPQEPTRRSMPVSAPVSREPPTPSGTRPTTNRVTLTAEEREIARNSFGPIKNAKGDMIDLTNEQKERLYAMNKAKLHRMRSTGEYRHTTEQTG